jgi:hypothetical protein
MQRVFLSLGHGQLLVHFYHPPSQSPSTALHPAHPPARPLDEGCLRFLSNVDVLLVFHSERWFFIYIIIVYG